MKKGFIRTKKARYGGMTVLLTVLLIATVVLFNVLFTTLAERYSWYADMRSEVSFEVTEKCYTLLGSVLEVFPGLPGSILEWLICLVLAGGGFSAVHLLSRREETLSGD